MEKDDGVVDPEKHTDIKSSIPFGGNSPPSISYNGDMKNYDWIPLTFLNLVLQSAFIPNTRVLSTLLVSQAGLGKTTKLAYLRQFDFVEYSLDVTPKLLMSFLDAVNDNKKKFLVIPDYIATLGHNKKTVELARSIFRAMIDEGVIKVSVFGMERDYKHTVKAGLVSGITSDFMNMNSRMWKSDGFLSRFLPFSYSHTNETKVDVIDNKLINRDTISEYSMAIKQKDVVEPTRTRAIDAEIRLIAYSLIEPKDAPYRAYDQVVALCNSSAVLRDSKAVELRDIDLVRKLSNFMNRVQHPL
jgi:hypothetical protein